jgi:hypothetical protein
VRVAVVDDVGVAARAAEDEIALREEMAGEVRTDAAARAGHPNASWCGHAPALWRWSM